MFKIVLKLSLIVTVWFIVFGLSQVVLESMSGKGWIEPLVAILLGIVVGSAALYLTKVVSEF